MSKLRVYIAIALVLLIGGFVAAAFSLERMTAKKQALVISTIMQQEAVRQKDEQLANAISELSLLIEEEKQRQQQIMEEAVPSSQPTPSPVVVPSPTMTPSQAPTRTPTPIPRTPRPTTTRAS